MIFKRKSNYKSNLDIEINPINQTILLGEPAELSIQPLLSWLVDLMNFFHNNMCQITHLE